MCPNKIIRVETGVSMYETQGFLCSLRINYNMQIYVNEHGQRDIGGGDVFNSVLAMW